MQKLTKFTKSLSDRYSKFKIRAIGATTALGATLCTSTFFVANAFAAGSIVGDTPADVDTGKLGAIISIVFWLVRIIIALVGIIPAIIKIVQGQSDENPRDRNSGIAAAGVAAAAIGVSFAMESWFKYAITVEKNRIFSEVTNTKTNQ
ncbi:MAG: hypothetical protein LBN95_00170 [Prevotellaceae bacterium]|jgi:hypothetical protein|nr:hypothetical protein [Prevotellaceae bacterium]